MTLCSLLLLGQGALSYEHHINSATDLIEFSNNVNSGKSYSGITVFLGADIDFSDGLSEQFEPVGNTETFTSKGYLMGRGTQSIVSQ